MGLVKRKLLSFAKVMEYYAACYVPLTLPSPPSTGERIKVRGSAGYQSSFHYLFMQKSITWPGLSSGPDFYIEFLGGSQGRKQGHTQG